MRGAWLGVQRSCGSARHRTSAVQQSWPAHVRHRSSKVRLRRVYPCLLFLQGLAPLRLVRGPRVRSASLRSVLGSRAQDPSGQSGGSRSGCWRRECQSKSATHCAGMNRRWKGFARQRFPSWHRRCEPSRLRPGRPSAYRTGCRSWSGSGSLRSPSPGTAQARHHPTLPDRLPGRRSTAFRALWHRKTHRRLPTGLHQYAIDITRCDHPPARLPAP